MNIQIGDRVETHDGKYHGTVSSLNRDADGIPCALLSGGNLDGYLESDCIFRVSSLRITQFEIALPPSNNIDAQKSEWQSMDIDSGLGIGGINNDQSMPFIPSARAIERVQKMHDTDTICKRCGASENFDGAMFTTLGGSGICDDCA